MRIMPSRPFYCPIEKTVPNQYEFLRMIAGAGGLSTRGEGLPPDLDLHRVEVMVEGPDRDPELERQGRQDTVKQRDGLVGVKLDALRGFLVVLPAGIQQTQALRRLVQPRLSGTKAEPAEDQAVGFQHRGPGDGQLKSLPAQPIPVTIGPRVVLVVRVDQGVEGPRIRQEGSHSGSVR